LRHLPADALKIGGAVAVGAVIAAVLRRRENP
jgi:hypothetical protein